MHSVTHVRKLHGHAHANDVNVAKQPSTYAYAFSRQLVAHSMRPPQPPRAQMRSSGWMPSSVSAVRMTAPVAATMRRRASRTGAGVASPST